MKNLRLGTQKNKANIGLYLTILMVLVTIL